MFPRHSITISLSAYLFITCFSGKAIALETPPFDASEHQEIAAIDQDFTPDDRVISDLSDSLIDPEFDKNLPSLRMAWQERSGQLWQTDVDGVTGAWTPSNGRQSLVDTDLTVVGKTRQGPEWAYDNRGNRLIYTKKMESGQPRLYQAWRNPTTQQLVKTPLVAGDNKALYETSHDLGDPTPRIIYSYRKADANRTTMAYGWREIDEPTTDALLPLNFQFPQWVSGRRAIVATARIDGVRQVVYYDIDTGKTTIITSDLAQKRFPLIWQDPATQSYVLSAVMDDTTIGIWRQKSQDDWVLTSHLNPPTELPYIFKPDWFVWHGASYLAYLMHTEKSGQTQNHQGKGEVWVSCMSESHCQFLHRQVNHSTITRIKDVENLAVDHTVYVYYAEILPDQRRLIHRADSGLSLSNP
ncbi:MAG: hypothetical protein IPI57_02270 [Candidatus Competibacteraceae bacterium]|nr:hypothetical protein [Candidatus Competibacteraceae bacterium]